MDAQMLDALIPLTAIVMGTLMFLIPIAAISVRYAIKPIMEAIRDNKQSAGPDTSRELSVLEQRVSLLEQQHQALENELGRLGDVKDFERRLTAPPDR